MAESRRRHQANVDRITDIIRRIDLAYDEALVPGWYGEILVRIPVCDGILQPTNGDGGMRVTTTRQHGR